MATIITRDGTEIFYKDWGTGPPVAFKDTFDADLLAFIKT